MKGGVSRYFDNTGLENFRCEETVGGVRFYDDTQHDRKLKVVATVESHGDYLDFTCEVCCGNGGIFSDILYPLAMNPCREIRGEIVTYSSSDRRGSPKSRPGNAQSTNHHDGNSGYPGNRACNSTLSTITNVYSRSGVCP